MVLASIELSDQKIADFCGRWQIRELAVFGSALRDDFGPASDIDVLVSFVPGTRRSLLDMVTAEEELSALLGRPVDLLDRSAVERSENWIRRRRILESARTIYAR
jgi:predicted nucleotidyltransferase